MLCRRNKEDTNSRWKSLVVCVLANVEKIVRKKQILYSKTHWEFLFESFLSVLITIYLDEKPTLGFRVG